MKNIIMHTLLPKLVEMFHTSIFQVRPTKEHMLFFLDDFPIFWSTIFTKKFLYFFFVLPKAGERRRIINQTASFICLQHVFIGFGRSTRKWSIFFPFYYTVYAYFFFPFFISLALYPLSENIQVPVVGVNKMLFT